MSDAYRDRGLETVEILRKVVLSRLFSVPAITTGLARQQNVQYLLEHRYQHHFSHLTTWPKRIVKHAYISYLASTG
jgi:hypothetical protein